MVGLGWSWRYDELNCAVGKRGGRHQQGICVTFSLLSLLFECIREREREIKSGSWCEKEKNMELT